MMLVGVRLALTIALLLTIAAEILTAKIGLGCLVWLSTGDAPDDRPLRRPPDRFRDQVAIRTTFDRMLGHMAPWRGRASRDRRDVRDPAGGFRSAGRADSRRNRDPHAAPKRSRTPS